MCVDGDPPACTLPGSVYVGGKCVAACPRGTKRIGNTKKCHDDPDVQCGDGEIKHPTKGCVSSSPSMLSGLLAGLAGTLGPSALSGLSSAGQALIAQELRQAVGAYANLAEGVKNYTQNILGTSLEVIIPSSADRDALIASEVAKPLRRLKPSYKVWGV